MHENTTTEKQTTELLGQRTMNTEITDCLENDVNRNNQRKLTPKLRVEKAGQCIIYNYQKIQELEAPETSRIRG